MFSSTAETTMFAIYSIDLHDFGILLYVQQLQLYVSDTQIKYCCVHSYCIYYIKLTCILA